MAKAVALVVLGAAAAWAGNPCLFKPESQCPGDVCAWVVTNEVGLCVLASSWDAACNLESPASKGEVACDSEDSCDWNSEYSFCGQGTGCPDPSFGEAVCIDAWNCYWDSDLQTCDEGDDGLALMVLAFIIIGACLVPLGAAVAMCFFCGLLCFRRPQQTGGVAIIQQQPVPQYAQPIQNTYPTNYQTMPEPQC